MRTRKDIIMMMHTMLAMLFGTFLLAFTYYHINFQNHLSEGGFVGLALLGKYILDIPPALSMILLDIPVLIVAWFLKGHKFIINTMIAAGMFSFFYAIMERYSTVVIDLNHNLLAAAVISGLLTGFGAGIVLRYGGATGGDDAISVLISEWSGLKVGTVFFLMDAVVLLLSLFYLPLVETLYTILAVSIAGQMITITATYGVEKKPKTARVTRNQVAPTAQHSVGGR
ncbi:YitT family protein [Paenibacillus sp. N3/727]|uniref:YitT family protein n=1 Tax=Paenibacillus sp. N3/727 TaxID=2925845 RepID=UPI001F53D303|nr:YitT family protein [Paenibacillus sp. N3/727]UNK20335.1 YitT family protein [Paenibacillus sp. N3/727]